MKQLIICLPTVCIRYVIYICRLQIDSERKNKQKNKQANKKQQQRYR